MRYSDGAKVSGHLTRFFAFSPDAFQPTLLQPTTMPPRTPLGLINANERSSGELTPYQRGIILGLHSQGASFRDIENQHGIARSTVADTIKFDSIRKDGHSVRRPSRPPKHDARVDRRIIRYVRITPKSTYKQMREALQILLSNNTIARILEKCGIKHWQATRQPFLTPEVASLRLAWAKEHLEWT